jgi:hypothetical protein
MDAEGISRTLLLLDEVVVSTELLQHVGHDHRAAVRFVKEVGELPLLCTIFETQRKERIRFDRHSLGLVSFLPKELPPCLVDLTFGTSTLWPVISPP